jgi:hypothetical protein
MAMWTIREERALRRIYPAADVAASDIRAALPRHSAVAIHCRARDLSLRRPNKPDGEVLPVVAELIAARRARGWSQTQLAGARGDITLTERGDKRYATTKRGRA